MADEDSPLLGDGPLKKQPTFMKTLKKGLISGGGTVAAFAGKELAKCIAKKMGWVSKKEKQMAEYKAWMESVSYDLEVIEQKIDELSKDINTGFNDMKAGGLYQAYERQYDELMKCTTNIDHAFEVLQDIVKSDYKTQDDTEGAINSLIKYSDAFLLDAVRNMAKICGAFPHKDSRSLLENWTDSCILSAGNNIEFLQRHYDSLERNFQLVDGYLIKAYTVLTTIRNYKTGQDTGEPDIKTSKWLEEEVKDYCQPIADTFINCVERLILSTYHPDINPVTVVFAADDVLTNIGLRSQLLTFLLVNMDVEKDSPGLIVKQYLRPSMLVNSKSKIFVDELPKAANDYQYEVAGQRWLPFDKYSKRPLMANWYKVVDRDSEGRLVAFENSDIVIMNYNLPFTLGQTDLEITSDNKTIVGAERLLVQKKVAYKYYVPDTLKVVEKDTDGGVCMAYVVITDFISQFQREAYYSLSYPGAQAGQYHLDNSDETELKEHAKKGTVHINGAIGYDPVSLIDVRCEFGSPLISTDHTLSLSTKYPLNYAGPAQTVLPRPGILADDIKLILINEMSLIVNVGAYKSSSMRKVDVEIDIYANQNNDKTGYFKHTYRDKTSLNQGIKFNDPDNGYSPAQAAFISDGQLGIPLVPDSKTELTWKVTLLIQGLHLGFNDADNKIRGNIYMRGRLAWPQPKPAFS